MDSGSYLPIYKVRIKISKVTDFLAVDILFKTQSSLDFSQDFWLPKDADKGFLIFLKLLTMIRLLIIKKVGKPVSDSVNTAKPHL